MSLSDQPCLSDQQLTFVLSGILKGKGISKPRILHRDVNPSTTTFPTEIVTIQDDGQKQLRLFCKHYDGRSDRDLGYGHRGGLPYEVAVYRNVLANAQATFPAFYGAYTDPTSNAMLLVLQFIEDAKPVKKSRGPSGMIKAAQWIAAFHREFDERGLDAPAEYLRQYDRDYYEGWPRRTKAVSGPLKSDFPWLPDVCDAVEGLVAEMCGLPPTVIHGAFYGKEVLMSNGTVYPVDWETAAIAFGEIDLAMLADHWGEEMTETLVAEYRRARWPDGVPYDFERAWDLARLYTDFRWLGDTPGMPIPHRMHWRLEEVRQIAMRRGLI